ncbi:MAG TPA: hypothetical protein VMF32_09020 [Xanthobacteraceae bacterium]|nr:hypothetical protein [Xanthobacteraceae bacterium]
MRPIAAEIRGLAPGTSALHNKTYPLRMILSALTNYDVGFPLEETAARLKKKTHRNVSPSTVASRLMQYKRHCSYRRLQRRRALSLGSGRDHTFFASRSFGGSWQLIATHPSGHQEDIAGFHTETEAIDWLSSSACAAWLRTRGYRPGAFPARSKRHVDVSLPLSVNRPACARLIGPLTNFVHRCTTPYSVGKKRRCHLLQKVV